MKFWYALCLALIVAGCCVDNDSDGYPIGSDCPSDQAQDCNDILAAINPGASELCNGMDDNCNKIADEGCVACNNNVCESGETVYSCPKDCLSHSLCNNTAKRFIQQKTLSPGQETDVYIAVCIQRSIGFKDSFYALSETFPSGFVLVSSELSTDDPGKVKAYKLNITVPEIREVLKYRVRAPTTHGTYNFNGQYFTEFTVPSAISGANHIVVQ